MQSPLNWTADPSTQPLMLMDHGIGLGPVPITLIGHPTGQESAK